MDSETGIEKLIRDIGVYAARAIPFFLIVDFEMQMPYLCPVEELPDDIRFVTPGFDKHIEKSAAIKKFSFSSKAIDFDAYCEAFKLVMENILAGNTYLLNLCFPSGITCNLSLKDIFSLSKAKYKLLYKDSFVVFSPETFISIKSGKICSYPMKGTIDASIPYAENILLSDEKEMAEHVTMVDLIRNDLSIFSRNVKLERFRYVEELQTNSRNLLQTSSVITGDLPSDYLSRMGEIIFSLLPAGSVSGAPKQETLRIISEAERRPRGYYTGIMGYFDGKDFDSTVLIRFIEKVEGELIYRSGGGITSMSQADKEYQELIDKIYVPLT